MHFSPLIEELNDAVAHGTPERRADILRRITDVFVAGSAGYSNNQIELFDEVYVQIAEAVESSARTMLANRLAKVPRSPPRFSRILASDAEINVAGPMLEQSEQVDNETLVAAARTQSQQHLLAISRRTSLDESVTDVLVERGDRPVVLSTASNPGARISNSGYMTLIRRSADDDELATCVGSRSDIPRQHLFRLIARASRDVQIKLEAAHPSMANTVQDAVAEAATMILDEAGAASRDYAVARAHVTSLHSAGTLGESEVAAFATANQFEETAAALAILCGLPIEAVDRAMAEGQHETMLVIAKAIGFSWPTLKTILRMCAGARGISPGELEQCLGTFSRLKLATARQVIQFQGKRFRGTRFGRPAA